MLPTTSFIIIGTLLAVSGVIAYFGDIVGKRMGKRRLSLFRLRPRQTGTVMSVATGVLIQVFSIAALTVISKPARTALFEFDALLENIRGLRQENRQLETQSRKIEAKSRQLNAKLQTTGTRLAAARAGLAKSASEIKRKRNQIRGLESRQRELTKEISRARLKISGTQALLAKAQTEYRVAQEQYKVARRRYEEANRNFLRAKGNYDDVKGKYDVIKTSLDEAQKRLSEVNRQLASANDELANREKELKNAERILANSERALQVAQREVETHQQQLTLLTTDLSRLQDTKKELTTKVAELRDERDKLQGERDKLVSAVQGYVGKDLVVERGEILCSEVVERGKPVSETERKLQGILDRARKVAEDKGARGQEGRPALSIPSRFVQLPDGRRIYFYQEHMVEHDAQEISQSSEDVVVEVVSLVNSVEGEPIDVDLRLFPNAVVFPQGTILLAKNLEGGAPSGQLFSDLLEMLEKVRGIARSKGMRGGPENRYGEIAYEELFSVLELVRRTKTPVVLEVIVGEDARVAGPMKIEMKVLKAPHGKAQS